MSRLLPLAAGMIAATWFVKNELSRSVFVKREDRMFPVRLPAGLVSWRDLGEEPLLLEEPDSFWSNSSSNRLFPKHGEFSPVPAGFYLARTKIGPFNSKKIFHAYLCSKAAYEEDPQSFLAKHCKMKSVDVARLPNGEFNFLVADTGEEVFIAYKGSTSWQDWIKNFSVYPTATQPLVHAGFSSCVPRIPLDRWRQSTESTKPIIFCGHSKGAAVAHTSLCIALRENGLADQNAFSIGFAVPLWADKALAESFTHWGRKDSPFLSIVASNDVVPYLLQPRFLEKAPASLLSYIASGDLIQSFSLLFKSVQQIRTPEYVPFGTTLVLNQTSGRVELFENLDPKDALKAYPRSLDSMMSPETARAVLDAHLLENYGLIISSMLNSPKIPGKSPSSHFTPQILTARFHEVGSETTLAITGQNLDKEFIQTIEISNCKIGRVYSHSRDAIILAVSQNPTSVFQPATVTVKSIFGETSAKAEASQAQVDPLNIIFPALLDARNPEISQLLLKLGVNPSQLDCSGSKPSPTFLGLLRILENGIISCLPKEEALQLGPEKSSIFIGTLLISSATGGLGFVLSLLPYLGPVGIVGLAASFSIFALGTFATIFANNPPIFADQLVFGTFYQMVLSFCILFDLSVDKSSIVNLCGEIKRFNNEFLPNSIVQRQRMEKFNQLVQDRTGQTIKKPEDWLRFIDAAEAFYDLASLKRVKNVKMVVVIGPKHTGKSTLLKQGFGIQIEDYGDKISSLGMEGTDHFYWANAEKDWITVVNTPGVNQDDDSWIDPADLRTESEWAPKIPLFTKTVYAILLDQTLINTRDTRRFVDKARHLFQDGRAVLVITKMDDCANDVNSIEPLEVIRERAVSLGIPAESIVLANFKEAPTSVQHLPFDWDHEVKDARAVADILRKKLQSLN